MSISSSWYVSFSIKGTPGRVFSQTNEISVRMIILPPCVQVLHHTILVIKAAVYHFFCLFSLFPDAADGHSSLLRVVFVALCGCDRGLTHSGWRTCILSPGSATYPPQTEVQILASHQSGEQ